MLLSHATIFRYFENVPKRGACRKGALRSLAAMWDFINSRVVPPPEAAMALASAAGREGGGCLLFVVKKGMSLCFLCFSLWFFSVITLLQNAHLCARGKGREWAAGARNLWRSLRGVALGSLNISAFQRGVF